MKTTSKNNKPSFSFSGTIFSVLLLMSIGLSSCKKDSIVLTPTTPTTPVVDKNVVPAQPNIKYAGHHKLVAIGAADGNTSTQVDINSDGTDDFTIAISKTATKINLYMKAHGRHSLTVRPNFVLGAYAAHAVINAESLSWNNASDMYRAGITAAGTFTDITKLTENTELYVGLKLLADGTHYGWLKIKYNVLTGASNGAVIEVIDGAYEQADGFAIEAGNTGL